MAGHGDGSSGSDSTGLNGPDGIYITAQNDLYVAEILSHRVRRFPNGSRNGTVIAGTVIPGSSMTKLNGPTSIFIDEVAMGLYVADMTNQRIQYFPNGSTTGVTVAGAGLGVTYGVRLDNNLNIFASDASNFRVSRWAPNSTSTSTIVAGGTYGSGPSSLNYPRQIDFDPTYTFLYVVDNLNHRIQMYNLVNTSASPLTVAGGNGPGTASNQLYGPNSVCVSRKTGALYITDASNHRVQRWNPGSSAGVTIAGSINGGSGNSAAQMSYPSGIALDANETFLYVSEFGNHRVQRFLLT